MRAGTFILHRVLVLRAIGRLCFGFARVLHEMDSLSASTVTSHTTLSSLSSPSVPLLTWQDARLLEPRTEPHSKRVCNDRAALYGLVTHDSTMHRRTAQ